MIAKLFTLPTTCSGIAFENGNIATACFDGMARLHSSTGNLIWSERRGTQITSIAIRNGVIATDTDESTLEEGVAITQDGIIMHGPDITTETPIISIDKTGRFGVGRNQLCYDRLTGGKWRCVPVESGHDKTPMGVELVDPNHLVIVALDGWARLFTLDGQLVHRWQLTPSGGNAVDVSSDGSRILVSTWDREVRLYNQSGSLLARCTLNSLSHDVTFEGPLVLIGTHLGEVLRWDGADGDAQSIPAPAPSPTPTKGKKK